jgi:uncharacterized membrane protein YfcA
MSTAELLVASLAVLVGSATQSVVGFGLNLIAVPAVLLAGLDELVPGALIVVLFVQAWTLIASEHRHVDWLLLKWFLPVRVVGTLAGLAVAVSLTGDAIIVIICLLVLTAVALSIGGWRVPPSPAGWMSTGFASGFSNVLSSIGGPPLSLAMTDHPPAAQRSTQGWSAVFGSAMSMVVLASAHRFGTANMRDGALLLPAALLGSYGVRPVRAHLPTAASLRPYVWAVAVIGSLAVIARTLLS